MSNLKQYDFNRATGWVSIIFISIAVSFVIFAAVYLFEGLGWLDAFKDEPVETYKAVGQNWVRGAGIAAVLSTALFIISSMMLKKNKQYRDKKPAIWNRFDFNNTKGALGLALIAVAFTFFFNAALYRYEYTVWALSAIAQTKTWYLEEASAWASAATAMALTGAVLSALGWLFIVLGWKKK